MPDPHRTPSRRPPAAVAATIAATLFFAASGAATTRTAPPAAAPPDVDPLAQARPEQWIEDLDTLAGLVAERHPDPWSRCPRDRFEAAADALRATVAQRTADGMIVEFARLVALLGDPQTSIGVDRFRLRFSTIPLRLEWLADGLLVVGADEAHAGLVGRRVVAIRGREPDRLLDAVTSVVATDNESGRRRAFESLWHHPELLELVGAVEPAAPHTLDLESVDGDVETIEIAPLPPRRAWREIPLVPAAADGPPPPRVPASGPGHYGLAGVPGLDAVYLRVDRTVEDRGRPFATVAEEAVARTLAGDGTRLVVDLRRNAGVDFRVVEPLIERLAREPKLHGNARVVVLIGPGTRAVAALAAHELRARCGAYLVGEPTGQAVPRFRGVRTIHLPLSGLGLWMSQSRAETPAAPQPDPHADSVRPDRLVPTTIADRRAGRDRPFEVAVSEDPRSRPE